MPEIDGSIEALEALSVASINVASISLMLTGGLMWALDISTMDDMRQKYHAKMGSLAEEKNPEDEKQMEEWVAAMMARLDIDPKEYTAEKSEKALGETETQADDGMNRTNKP